eukprot:2273151-Amphidinium_carterae.1
MPRQPLNGLTYTFRLTLTCTWPFCCKAAQTPTRCLPSYRGEPEHQHQILFKLRSLGFSVYGTLHQLASKAGSPMAGGATILTRSSYVSATLL